MHTTVSIINIYKEGSLAIQQAGKSMSTKIVILCKKCPSVKRGNSQQRYTGYTVTLWPSYKTMLACLLCTFNAYRFHLSSKSQ